MLMVTESEIGFYWPSKSKFCKRSHDNTNVTSTWWKW